MDAPRVSVRQGQVVETGNPAAAHGPTAAGVDAGQGSESQLRETAVAENRSQVIDAMVHAVSNSLNSIMSASQFASLLIMRGKLDEARSSLGRLEQECLRAARLLRDGRNLATLEVPDARGGVDVAALLTACAAACLDLGDVRVECEAGLPLVHGQADALKRLFVEILDNAFQFGAHDVAVTAVVDGRDGVLVEFRDDGQGIHVPSAKLFASFVTSDPAEHNGLGLAFAARIAAAYGGSIGLAGSSQGATFWVRLAVEATH